MGARLFGEPNGWRTGGLWVAIGLFFLVLAVYFRIDGGRGASSALHFGVLWLLLGIPELLPKERTRVAGGLRIIGLMFGVALIVFYLSQLSVFQ